MQKDRDGQEGKFHKSQKIKKVKSLECLDRSGGQTAGLDGPKGKGAIGGSEGVNSQSIW